MVIDNRPRHKGRKKLCSYNMRTNRFPKRQHKLKEKANSNLCFPFNWQRHSQHHCFRKNTATNTTMWVGFQLALFFFLKKKKSLVVLEYIHCPAIVLPCVSLTCVMWFVSHSLTWAPLARRPGPTLVCRMVCVRFLSPDACFSCLFASFLRFSISLSSPSCIPIIHSHTHRKWK